MTDARPTSTMLRMLIAAGPDGEVGIDEWVAATGLMLAAAPYDAAIAGLKRRGLIDENKRVTAAGREVLANCGRGT